MVRLKDVTAFRYTKQQAYFNSKMVRLKADFEKGSRYETLHFNSKMVRLKGTWARLDFKI